MPKDQRRGDKETRKPKAARAFAVVPVSPFAKKDGAAPEAPPKRKD